jgi:hypothetical protein
MGTHPADRRQCERAQHDRHVPWCAALRTGMVDPAGRWVVLSDHEQKAAWKDAARCFDVEAEGPVRASRQPTHWRTRESHGLDELAVGGFCVGVMLVFIGAPVVGLVVGGATAFGWLLWRPLPHLSTTTAACALLLRGDVKGASDAGGRVGGLAGVPTTHQRRKPTRALPKGPPGPAARLWTGHREGGQR